MAQNKNTVLIMGKPNSGKTTSLRHLDQENMVYLNADLKETPFRDRFMASVEIADAYEVLNHVDEIENTNEVTGAVLDTITFLMAMFERQYVVGSVNTQAAWGAYGNFYRDLIHRIKAGSKNYAIMAHEDTIVNEETSTFEAKVPIKGAVGKVGVEADFTTILATRQIQVKKLEGIENDLLHITDEEREDGMKYVFMTRITKDTPGHKMRSAMGLWQRNELYIDNDLKQVFDRLKSYYG